MISRWFFFGWIGSFVYSLLVWMLLVSISVLVFS